MFITTKRVAAFYDKAYAILYLVSKINILFKIEVRDGSLKHGFSVRMWS